MPRSFRPGSDRRMNAWVRKIIRRATTASKAAGGDYVARRAAAIKTVSKVRPCLSTADVPAALYTEC